VDSQVQRIPSAGAAEVLERIRQFISGAKRPAVLEPGEAPLHLLGENFALNPRGPAVSIECWTDQRNLVRRVRRIVSERAGRMELEAERFGGRTGPLLLLDLARPAAASVTRHGVRLEYRERFRRSLHRQFPDWKLVELSTEPDLHHSLSPSYARAYLRRGNLGIAAIGASENCLDPDGALSFGLIWLDHLRRREKRTAVEALAVFLPEGREAVTCHRIRHLDPRAARYAVLVQTPDGYEELVNPGDYTNLSTRLDPLRQPRHGGEVSGWIERIARIEGVEQRGKPDGSVHLSVRGLPFARISGDALLFGLDHMHAAGGEWHVREVEQIAEGLARYRRSGQDRTHPLYTARPEAWLESQIRKSLETLDATLLPDPVYEQAPHMGGGERGIVDLLAVDRSGRLAVIEIKVHEDIHLPLQALDYWMRVKWHVDRDEFARNGYFPGIALRPEAPRLLLVAPALDFHPTNESVLHFFSPEIAAERVGVGIEWREEVSVMFRARSGM
jgi:hypothetical protein